MLHGCAIHKYMQDTMASFRVKFKYRDLSKTASFRLTGARRPRYLYVSVGPVPKGHVWEQAQVAPSSIHSFRRDTIFHIFKPYG